MNALVDHPLGALAPRTEGLHALHLAAIRPSPTNPRKHFAAAGLTELAESIQAQGLLQPILVRPLDMAGMASAPCYEIVCGERRWRACREAGLSTVLAIVRVLTDFEALEAQVVENLQRDDLTELEEAEGYRALMRTSTGLQGYANADELAARIGRSRSYVFQRLKLLDLAAPGREALASGKIAFSVALLIARLPNAADQAKATATIVAGDQYSKEPFTFKDAADYIHNEFHLELDRATFKITDATLVPAAGSCRDCGKRTGASPDLFADVKKADTCTDAACYHAKEAAHRVRLKAAAEERGLEVIDGAAAKKARPRQYGDLKGYLELDKVHYAFGNKPLRKLLGKKLPKVYLLEDPHNGGALVEVVDERDALAALKEAGVIKQAKLPSGTAQQRDAERKAKAETAWRQAVAQACVDAAPGTAADEGSATLRAAVLLEAVVVLWCELDSDTAKRAEKLLGWPPIEGREGRREKQAARIRGLDAAGFARVLVAATLAGEIHSNQYSAGKPERVLKLAELLGIDHKAIREEQRQLLREKTGKAARKKAATPATPETALATALKKAKTDGARKPAVKYRDTATGSTWSGRGLQPKWLKAALEGGKKLADFAVAPATKPAVVTLSAAAADPFHSEGPQA